LRLSGDSCPGDFVRPIGSSVELAGLPVADVYFARADAVATIVAVIEENENLNL
jgi:hypothetical protein